MGGTLPALALCWVLPGGIARIPGVWTLWVPGWGARTELQHPACRASERNQSSSVAVETGGETQFLAASTSLPGILRSLASGGVKRSPPPPISHRCWPWHRGVPPLPFAGEPTGSCVPPCRCCRRGHRHDLQRLVLGGGGGGRAAPQLCCVPCLGKTLMYFQCICVI